MATTIPVPVTKRPSMWTNRNNLRRFTPPPIYNTSPTDGRLVRILASVARTCEIDKAEFVPVTQWKQHIRVLELSDHPQCLIDKFREDHERYYATQTNRRKYSDPGVFHVDLDYTDEVVVKTTMDGDCTLIETITPFKNFNSVSPRDTLDMYRQYGVSPEAIRKLEKRIVLFEKSIPEREAHLARVFSKFTGKSQSKKKVQSLRSRMCKRTKVILKSEIEEEE